MPNDTSAAQKHSSDTTPRKIRSMHRRRLLNRLTEGGGTVSVLAREVGLRVPHASAELRRMRNDGLVASDLSAGSRGARIHLTESGWESVRDDELARATEASPLPDDTSMCCLLARDGPNLLLGVMEPTDSPIAADSGPPPETRRRRLVVHRKRWGTLELGRAQGEESEVVRPLLNGGEACPPSLL